MEKTITKLVYDLNNVSEDIDAHSIVKDFLTFVEEDVKAN